MHVLLGSGVARVVRSRRGGAVAMLVMLLLALSAPPALGGDPTVSGWVVVREPSDANYVPAARDRGNSAGDIVRVIRQSKGVWEIRMKNLDAGGGHVQVSPLNGKLRFCSVEGWAGGPTLKIRVRCTKRNGALVDTRFVATYTQLYLPVVAGTSDRRLAYLWNNHAGQDHTPQGTYQSSWNGQDWTMEHIATGTYAAHLPIVTDSGGSVQLSHYDVGSVTCMIDDWGAVPPSASIAGLPELLVRYRCRNAAGSLADARSTLLYLYRWGPEGRTGGPSAYLFADRLHQNAPYHPDAARRFVTNGGQATVDRLSTGVYRVTLTKVPSGGAALVTSVGDLTAHCQPSAIRGSGHPLRITVKCFTPDGDAVDGEFTLAWTK